MDTSTIFNFKVILSVFFMFLVTLPVSSSLVHKYVVEMYSTNCHEHCSDVNVIGGGKCSSSIKVNDVELVAINNNRKGISVVLLDINNHVSTTTHLDWDRKQSLSTNRHFREFLAQAATNSLFFIVSQNICLTRRRQLLLPHTFINTCTEGVKNSNNNVFHTSILIGCKSSCPHMVSNLTPKCRYSQQQHINETVEFIVHSQPGTTSTPDTQVESTSNKVGLVLGLGIALLFLICFSVLGVISFMHNKSYSDDFVKCLSHAEERDEGDDSQIRDDDDFTNAGYCRHDDYCVVNVSDKTGLYVDRPYKSPRPDSSVISQLLKKAKENKSELICSSGNRGRFESLCSITCETKAFKM